MKKPLINYFLVDNKRNIILFLMFFYSINLFSGNDIITTDETRKYNVPVVLTTRNKASVSSEIGSTINNILIKEGDFFKKDDIILKFNCTLFDAKLKKSWSELNLAKNKYDSYQRLSNLDGASKMELVTSQSEYEQAKAEYDISKYNAEQCILKAPFGGQLVELFVNEHETIKVGQKLYDIVDNKNLEVSIIVDSDWLMWLKEGDNFQLYINETHKSYTGEIAKIIYSVDAVSQSIRLIGSIQGNQEGLFIGASGTATFKGP